MTKDWKKKYVIDYNLNLLEEIKYFISFFIVV